MKHYKLLMASLLLAIGGGNSVAQTDVAGQYIKNPGFEGTSTQFLQINKDGRGVQKPEGWSVEWYQDNADNNGMTYVADNLNQDGKNGVQRMESHILLVCVGLIQLFIFVRLLEI